MRTKLSILSVLFLSFYFTAFSQKIKVKQESVLYDKTEIAKIKELYKDSYELYDLKGKKLFSVVHEYVGNESQKYKYQWLTLKNADESKTTQVYYDQLKFSLNNQTVIVDLLSKKYGLLDEKGPNPSKIDEFFAEERENLSEKYPRLIAEEKAKIEAEKAEIARIQTEMNPKIGNDGYLYLNNKIVGKLQKVKTTQNTSTELKDLIYLVDLDNNKIITLKRLSSHKYQYKTIDDNMITYDTNDNYVYSDLSAANKMYMYALLNGYKFGHEKMAEKKEMDKAKFALALENSINIDGLPGYLVDGKGEKYEGQIVIFFEDMDLNNPDKKEEDDDGQYLEIGGDNFGQNVFVFYNNDKGKEKRKGLDASEGGYFCVTENSEERCYYGVKTKGEALKKVQNLSTLKLNSAYYYLLLKKYDDIMLLQDPVEKEKYVFKIPSDSKGQMIDERDSEKLSEKIAEYLSSCSSLSNQIKNNEFDLKTETDLLQITEAYHQCKK